MEWLLIPALVMLVAPSDAFTQADLTRFDRIAREQGRALVVIESDGRVRVGRLATADAGGLTLAVRDQRYTLSAAGVARVDRDGDSVVDGLVKGALFGIVMGLPAAGFYRHPWQAVAGSALSYGLVGVIVDWNHHGKTPVYRAAGKGTP